MIDWRDESRGIPVSIVHPSVLISLVGGKGGRERLFGVNIEGIESRG
jgi:hypothetical protein